MENKQKPFKNQLEIFERISNFIDDINLQFKIHNIKELYLYNALINRTTFNDKYAINKHINSFKDFYEKNIENIINNEYTFNTENISYSDKVFIPIQKIFNLSDENEKKIIYQHLTGIFLLLDTRESYQHRLKNMFENTGDIGKKIIEIFLKIQSVLPDNFTWQQAIPIMVSSGLLQEIFSEFKKIDWNNIDQLIDICKQVYINLYSKEKYEDVDPIFKKIKNKYYIFNKFIRKYNKFARDMFSSISLTNLFSNNKDKNYDITKTCPETRNWKFPSTKCDSGDTSELTRFGTNQDNLLKNISSCISKDNKPLTFIDKMLDFITKDTLDNIDKKLEPIIINPMKITEKLFNQNLNNGHTNKQDNNNIDFNKTLNKVMGMFNGINISNKNSVNNTINRQDINNIFSKFTNNDNNILNKLIKNKGTIKNSEHTDILREALENKDIFGEPPSFEQSIPCIENLDLPIENTQKDIIKNLPRSQRRRLERIQRLKNKNKK